MTYLENLTEAMTAAGRAGALFVGQAIAYPGTAMTKTFEGVPRSQLIELPVFENTQLGLSIGLSIASKRPVISVFPRINFLLCAMDQLILHLDAIPRYSDYQPRVIIRTAVASAEPLDPGAQHLGDYAETLRHALHDTPVVVLSVGKRIPYLYKAAVLALRSSTIMIEYAEDYGDV